MGKITDALRKAAEERIERLDKISRVKEREQLIVRKIGDSKVDPRVIAYFDSKALITEQYKILRTNLLSINKGKPPKVIVVTSSLHSEGKTITAVNLAVVLAQSTKRPKVLLIDADLRRGKVAKYLGVHSTVGLADILTGAAQPADALFNIDIDNLTFIAAGSSPENPAELLDSENMKGFISAMKMKFDHVVIDTPPIISVTDAGLIAGQADGVLMVIQAGRTQRGIIQRATELLNQAHSNILGHVLTNIEYHLPEYIYRYL
ncbi:MAG: CpsD/CapB family tyrosine-protein kinase [Candidatus Omnitrophota bacterium]